jgi:hypothetical protein
MIDHQISYETKLLQSCKKTVLITEETNQFVRRNFNKCGFQEYFIFVPSITPDINTQ